MRVRVRNFSDPPESAPVGIFARDHYLSSSFGLIMVPMLFCVILRLQVFSRARVRHQIPVLFRERNA